MSFLQSLFGPSRDEVWRELCRQIGADFVDGGFWKGSRVQARVGPWTITLDTYTVSTGDTSHTYTRMRAPYLNRDGFRFSISRKGIFSDFAKWFGMQDVQVGRQPFDEDFIIQGNNEERLRQLFANDLIRGLIQNQPSLSFMVKDDEGWFAEKFPEGVDELYFVCGGVIRDVERLKDLYALFAETLQQLGAMGSAAQEDPRLQL